MYSTIRAVAAHQIQASMTKQKAIALWFFAGLLVFVLSIFAASDARAQVTPAGQSIGNQASATYVDVTNASLTLTSTSNVVTTVVSQVYSFTLAAPGAQTRPANQQVCYPHTITNTGNGADVFTLTAPVGATVTGPVLFYQTGTLLYYPDVSPNDGSPDVGPAISVTPTLSAGQAYTFVVCGTTSASAVAGNSGTITIAATSSGAAPLVPAVVDTTTIGNCSITLNKSLSSTLPPGVTPVTGGLSPLTNVVGNPGLYVVLAYSNAGTLACSNVIIQDPLQAGFLYRTGSGRWSNTGATVLTDASDGVVSGINYVAPIVDLTSGTVSATIASIAGGTSGNVYFQVSIAANLAVGISASTTNTANVTYTDASVAVTTGPNNSNAITYNVQQVAAVEFNGSATSSVAAAGEGSGTTIVAAASPGQTIQWTDVVWNKGNASDSFDIRFVDGLGAVVGNSASFTGANCTGAAAASPACTFPAGTTFTVFRTDGTTTLLDTSGNTTPDTGPIPMPSGGNCPVGFVGNAGAGLATSCGYQIVVKATIPALAATGGGPYRIVLQARSVFDAAVVDTVPNVLTTITANSVDLTNNTAGGLGAGAGTATIIVTNNVTPLVSATQTTKFILFVNNTGAVAAVYDLTGTFVAVPASVGLAAQPLNWVIQFRQDGGAGNCSTVGSVITSTGAVPVPALGSQLVCGEVVIPPTNQGNGGSRPTDSPPGNYDVQFRAQQQGNPAVADTIVDRIILASVNSVTITPNGTQQTSPGGAVTYQHTMTNSGNVAEIISFAALFLTNSQGGGWTSAAYVDDGGTPVTPVSDSILTVGSDTTLTTAVTFTMAPNTIRTLFVRVNAPAMAGSPPNVTTLTATYNGILLNVSATDTTTLTSGLRLDKYQRLVACGSVPLPVPPTFTGLTADAPWVSSALPSGSGTAPGQCIAYLVVGTNTTSNNISNITISDVVPTFTTYQTACSPTAPAGTTGPLTTSSVPANNGVGTISAVSAPAPGGVATPASALLPGGRVTLQFCVKIN